MKADKDERLGGSWAKGAGTAAGGGVYVFDGELEMVDSEVTYNYAPHGAGFAFESGVRVTLTNTRVVGNVCPLRKDTRTDDGSLVPGYGAGMYQTGDFPEGNFYGVYWMGNVS